MVVPALDQQGLYYSHCKVHYSYHGAHHSYYKGPGHQDRISLSLKIGAVLSAWSEHVPDQGFDSTLGQAVCGPGEGYKDTIVCGRIDGRTLNALQCALYKGTCTTSLRKSITGKRNS
jgi:hypothetical protein